MIPPLIELEGVSVVRDGRRILDSVTLSIERGEHTAILGPNGCGKSTLIRLLTREIYPYGGEGRVAIDGRERWVQSELRTLIGIVAQEPSLGDPTGLELAVSGLIGSFGVLVQHEVTDEMLDRGRAALASLEADRLSQQAFSTMSAGERKRCLIARALVSRPIAIVLDEPTTGLDIKARQHLLGTLRTLAQSGVTLILVTHHLEELIPEFNRVILLRDGAIFADGCRDEILTSANLQRLFDLPHPLWDPNVMRS